MSDRASSRKRRTSSKLCCINFIVSLQYDTLYNCHRMTGLLPTYLGLISPLSHLL